MTDVLATWTGAATATTAGAATGAVTGAAESVDSDASPATRSGGSSVPGYGLYATADGHQVALGVVNEPHFWSALCAELGLEPLRHLAFDERSRRGRELDEAVAQAVAARTRDELVTALTLAGVPVAPVLDRRAVVANGPFPSFPAFPIRLGADAGGGAGEAAPTAPKLDEHHGQGFR
jgi:crotonobetainyl-CoA:carnitine CoA-transferase CaiB-like acyl-CoA transferase